MNPCGCRALCPSSTVTWLTQGPRALRLREHNLAVTGESNTFTARASGTRSANRDAKHATNFGTHGAARSRRVKRRRAWPINSGAGLGAAIPCVRPVSPGGEGGASISRARALRSGSCRERVGEVLDPAGAPVDLPWAVARPSRVVGLEVSLPRPFRAGLDSAARFGRACANERRRLFAPGPSVSLPRFGPGATRCARHGSFSHPSAHVRLTKGHAVLGRLRYSVTLDWSILPNH